MRATREAAAAGARLLIVGVVLLGIAVVDSGRASTDSLLKLAGKTGYGCRFMPSICSMSEVCFDDNLFGLCSNLLDDRNGGYWYKADANLRDTLEDVLSDLLVMGYSWKDAYTQCLVDAVLRSYRQQTIFRASVCSRYDSTLPTARGVNLGSDRSSYRGRDERKVPSTTKPRRRTEEEETMGRPRGENELRELSELSETDLKTLRLLVGLMDDVQGSRIDSRGGSSPSHGNQRNDGSRGTTTKGKKQMISSKQSDNSPTRLTEAKKLLNAPSDKDTLLLKLLTGELVPDQVPTDVALELTDYIGSLINEAHAQRPTAATEASEGATFGDAAHRFGIDAALLLPTSKLSTAGEAASAKIMTGIGVDTKITQAQVRSEDRQKSSASNDSEAFNAPRQLAYSTKTLQDELVGHATSSVVNRESPTKIVETVITNEITNVSQSEAYAWMVLSSSISPVSVRRLVSTLQFLLTAHNVTSVAQVRVERNAIIVAIPPNADRHELDNLVNFISEHKDIVEKTLGVSIMKSGVGGDVATTSGSEVQFSLDVVPQESTAARRQMFIVIFVLCGAAIGIAVALAFICAVRRCQQLRGWRLAPDKDSPLISDEADEENGCLTHDYEDLVRQHIHSKTSEQSDSSSGSMGAFKVSPANEADGSSGRRSARSSQSSWSEEPAVCSMDVSTGHMILSYMEDHLKNKDRLDEEWQSLCSYRADLSGVDVALLPNNKKRNRYTDVLPYDHNRVVLDETKNVSGDDYINASFVADHHPRTASYIATQGPLATSLADFWQMVWERGTVVVVMLTRLNDNGSTGGSPCHRYWPSGSSELYHIYEVHLVSEHVWCEDYLVRSFYLKNLETSETRTVTQFHFLAWPEGGVPASTKSLLDFRRKMNKSYRGRSCPIVVVCSDGAGRSGAFILLDMVINRLCKGAKEIDMAATLEHIRDQRMAAVQTKEQFEFVLSAIAEEVQAMLLSS